ncbi:hypothetical protein [Streptomyces alkaliterrae]|uniref:Uncharacterized protein n=1 Tax=Streptomyces alkaliterrae TaxID=2213162 RepID=A0A5P0YQJ1_9ACTN|nr:hypothetical protein [Streptomyces alkaliterrae]MBB1253054.1 hypothetical protein [Streptomyces alkaliterrae]MBB1257879.1 hypothetical protein [Streptomyces alkaliterrae]MQS02535.1 hypothetical protein [Streptomyces alkaliterrae]
MEKKRPPEPEYPVVVGSFGENSRYRLVWLRGIGWEPLAREDFEARVREVFPDIDLDDPEQVHWVDGSEEWPAWHPPEHDEP